jgi:hypothetical protein
MKTDSRSNELNRMADSPTSTITVEKEVPFVNYELIEGQVKHLQGQILTISEAVLEGAQLNATKSLIKDRFNETLTRIFEVFMYNGNVPEGAVPNYED